MGKPIKYTKVKVIKITETQHSTLLKLKKYNVNSCDFIRKAISEKLKRDYEIIIEKPKVIDCPF
jgi:uncharacterized protein YabE (DUF348 family)